MGRLDGKTAIVTGGGQGVGRGIALAFAKEGARVAVVGRTVSKCQRVAEEIRAIGGTAIAVACNVTSREDVDAAVSRTVETFGTVDILVNNVAESRPPTPLMETTPEAMAVAFNSSVMGTLYFMQACFPYLSKAGHGKVINLGSAAGIIGQTGQTAYAAAKEGVRAMTRVAAREWGRYGINVNVICPLANSPGTERVAEETPERMKQMLATLAIRRLGDCEDDIGRTAVYLASPDADYVTGQTLNVDGGAVISA